MHFVYPRFDNVHFQRMECSGWIDVAALLPVFATGIEKKVLKFLCDFFIFLFYVYMSYTKEKGNTVDRFFFFFFFEKLMEKSGRKMRIDVGEIWNRFAGFFIRNSYKLKIRDGIFCIKHAFRKLLRIIWCRECVESS